MISKEKRIKGVVLDLETIEIINEEAKKQMRKFSSQAAFILKEWVEKKKKENKKEN